MGREGGRELGESWMCLRGDRDRLREPGKRKRSRNENKEDEKIKASRRESLNLPAYTLTSCCGWHCPAAA